ncbi:cytochrome d ubiquinol oxidase subunit II [Actinoplanes octamycinicus]|uniref:Cytochrome d ubiquinol oxidase subunit II n=1 Tax=Actinoplanes octamycinicus TaxID=135948 RepID=A0A7W7MBL8_9ACTN|nr:cytochrome d ubiquinol oxidase subunit II [Actinoplanes octamycinicus]MBB4744182.1 cytochrome d ubiquinol oxidase subunit II [Actinoplanes octamycinicus]GIE56860.1 cytochrome D ubiquinol oxidase subunit II [Actinoplanes octamycinicus]
MSAATAVAAVMVLAVTLYACTGLADHGAGIWDLTAGGSERGRRPRSLIDNAITPVWEANHVWLIYLLVLCWTAFGDAFAAIMSTLFVPLALGLLGIVLRAAGFAMSKDATRARVRHVAGWVFGVGSFLTPFWLGTALGAVVTGRVPAGNAAGNEVTSWLNPAALLIGLLTVAVGAYVSAVYLLAEARRQAMPDLLGYFRPRALVAGGAGVLAGVAALIALRVDNPQMADRLLSRGWPLLVLSVLALAGSFLLATGIRVWLMRLVAAAGIAALVWAWAVAQYPYLLPFTLTVSEGAASAVTLRWLLIWFVAALVLVIPALILLFRLDQRGELGEESAESLGDVVPDPQGVGHRGQ